MHTFLDKAVKDHRDDRVWILRWFLLLDNPLKGKEMPFVLCASLWHDESFCLTFLDTVMWGRIWLELWVSCGNPHLNMICHFTIHPLNSISAQQSEDCHRSGIAVSKSCPIEGGLLNRSICPSVCHTLYSPLLLLFYNLRHMSLATTELIAVVLSSIKTKQNTKVTLSKHSPCSINIIHIQISIH